MWHHAGAIVLHPRHDEDLREPLVHAPGGPGIGNLVTGAGVHPSLPGVFVCLCFCVCVFVCVCIPFFFVLD